MITFPHEVQLFWHKKASGASLLFFANRYLTLFFFIFTIATGGPMSDSVSLYVLHYASKTDRMHSLDVRIHNLARSKSGLIPIHCSCNRVVKFGETVSDLQYLPWACELYVFHDGSSYLANMASLEPVFSALRVFALSRQNYTLSIVVFSLSIVPLWINLVSYQLSRTGCCIHVEAHISPVIS